MEFITAETLLKEVMRLTLTVVSGAELLGERHIVSSRVQRPGLALAGYFDHVRRDRVELFGETEIKFLRTLSSARRIEVLNQLAQQNNCLFVVSKNLDIPEELLTAAKNSGVPVVHAIDSTVQTANEIGYCLDFALAPETVIHGVCVEIYGLGIILTGKSGIGKSECALELVKRGHRLVADDVIFLKQRHHYLVGTASDMLRNYIELRGVGILDLCKMFGVAVIRHRKKIDLFIDFIDYNEWNSHAETDRLGGSCGTRNVLGIEIAQAICPVSPGRNMAEIVELVAKNHMLRLMGHDSAAVFAETIAKRALGSEVDPIP